MYFISKKNYCNLSITELKITKKNVIQIINNNYEINPDYVHGFPLNSQSQSYVGLLIADESNF